MARDFRNKNNAGISVNSTAPTNEVDLTALIEEEKPAAKEILRAETVNYAAVNTAIERGRKNEAKIAIFDMPVKIESGELREGNPNLPSACEVKVRVDLNSAMRKDVKQPDGNEIKAVSISSREMANGNKVAHINFIPNEIARMNADSKSAFYKDKGSNKSTSVDRIDITVRTATTTPTGQAGVNLDSIKRGVAKTVGLNYLLTAGKSGMFKSGKGAEGKANDLDTIKGDINAVAKAYNDFVSEKLKEAFQKGGSGVKSLNGTDVPGTAFPALSRFNGVKLGTDKNGALMITTNFGKDAYVGENNKQVVEADEKKGEKFGKMTLGKAIAAMTKTINTEWSKALAPGNKDLTATTKAANDLSFSQKTMAQSMKFGAELHSVLGADSKPVPDVMQVQTDITGELSPYVSTFVKAAKAYSRDEDYGYYVEAENGEKGFMNKDQLFGEDVINVVNEIYIEGNGDRQPARTIEEKTAKSAAVEAQVNDLKEFAKGGTSSITAVEVSTAETTQKTSKSKSAADKVQAKAASDKANENDGESMENQAPDVNFN